MKKIVLAVIAAGVMALGGYATTSVYDYSIAEARADEAASIDAGLTVSPDAGVSVATAKEAAPGDTQGVSDPISDPTGYSKDVLDAFRAAQYAFFVVLVLFAISRGALWVGDKYTITWLVKARPYLVFGSSVLGGAILSLAALEHIDLRVVAGAIAAAFMLELRGKGGNVEARAKTMYEAYAASTGWKSAVSGQPLPEWAAVPEGVRNGWLASAKTV